MRSITYSKVRKKVFAILYRIFYHNYSYKPKGFYLTSKEYVAAQRQYKPFYCEVYSDLCSELNISPGLYNAYTYLKPNLSVRTTYLVVGVKNGRLHTDNAASIAIISEDNKLIGDVSFSYKNGRIISPEKNNIFKQKYFSKPKVYHGVVFSMLTGGSGLNNYGHWMVDVLPRLHLLKQSGLYNTVDYFLVPTCKYDYQRDTLKMLGIPENKIINGEKNTHIVADTLLVSTAPRGNDAIVPMWVIQFLKENFSENKVETPAYPPYIYVSRKDSKIRNVSNEDELMLMLSKYSFKSYELSSLSFIEKVRLFTSAKVVVSATGAGLTNILFCEKGTKVLEIFNDGFVVGPFYDIADKVDLDYHYIVCNNGSKARNPKQGQQEDIKVDLKQVQEKLESILKEVKKIESN